MTIVLSLTFVIAMQTAPATEWKSHVPTAEGWRGVRPGMTIDEVTRALPNEVVREKDVTYADGSTGPKAKVRKKVKIDSIDYEVSFYFNTQKQLDSIALFSNKVKKETFSEVIAALTGLLGEPTDKDAKSFADGGKRESVSWKDGERTLTVTSGTMPLGGFITGRLVSVAMNYKKNQDTSVDGMKYIDRQR